jgi:hypothetical protein
VIASVRDPLDRMRRSLGAQLANYDPARFAGATTERATLKIYETLLGVSASAAEIQTKRAEHVRAHGWRGPAQAKPAMAQAAR